MILAIIGILTILASIVYFIYLGTLTHNMRNETNKMSKEYEELKASDEKLQESHKAAVKDYVALKNRSLELEAERTRLNNKLIDYSRKAEKLKDLEEQIKITTEEVWELRQWAESTELRAKKAEANDRNSATKIDELESELFYTIQRANQAEEDLQLVNSPLTNYFNLEVNKSADTYFYYMALPNGNYKIGITSNFEKRYTKAQRREFKLLFCERANNAKRVESNIAKKFSHYIVNDDEYLDTKGTEIFSTDILRLDTPSYIIKYPET